MLAIGKDVSLQWQKSAPGIDQIHARQVVLFGDFLEAKVLFDGHWIVRAALDRRVVGDQRDFFTVN